MRTNSRAGWGLVPVLALMLSLSASGAAWAGLSGHRSFSAVGRSDGVRIAAPGDSENGFVYVHDVTLVSCEAGNIQLTVLLDYDFPAAPHLAILESANGTELGTYESTSADDFFSDSPQNDKLGDVSNDFAEGELGMSSTYSWDVLFTVDDEPVAEWLIQADCGEESASATEVYPAPALPGPALIGAALLLLGIGIATLRIRG